MLGVSLAEVYVTNAFPFVKGGPMSAALRVRDVREAARVFLARELQLAKPTHVFALGVVAKVALEACATSYIHLPHPAARIGGLATHEEAWRVALSKAGFSGTSGVA